MKKLLMAAGVWQLYRMGQRRRMSLRRSRRTRNVVSVLALVGGGAAAYYFVARQRGEGQQAQWPSRKKIERDARQAEARMRAQQGNDRPPSIRVEQNAGTDLKVPLGDITR